MRFVIIIVAFVATEISSQCQHRNYGNGGTVCVCNSTHCDTVPKLKKLALPEFLMYTSNKNGLRFHQTIDTFNYTNSSNVKLYIDDSKRYQTILGWGGAFTDSAGINIHSLPKPAQDKLLKSYFSEDGLEYSLCRVPIGGTDFSIRAYSYDDGPPDPYLLNFQLAPEDYTYKIPYILAALNLTGNNLKFVGTTWAAPKWMKTNNDYAGLGTIRENMLQSWSDYFIKFLDAYQKFGIKFWGITTGNEPNQGWILFEHLEVVAWPVWLMKRWIRNYLGPTIRLSQYSDLKIIMLDDQRAYLPWYPFQVFSDTSARSYVDGIGVHWYLDTLIPPKVLTKTHELYPEKFILMTEGSIASYESKDPVSLGSWKRGEEYSVDIIENMHHSVAGWMDWNMALNLDGGPSYINNYVDSPIIVNASGGEFYKQPTYYHLGHFSKFVPPGSIKIKSELNHHNVHHVAFKRPDNGTAVVILNKTKKNISIVIHGGQGRKGQIEVSEKSITTILFW